MAALLVFAACQSDMDEPPAPLSEIPDPFAGEVAYPGQEGILTEGLLYGAPITYSLIDNKAVFQGDILLSREQLTAPAPEEGQRVKGTGRSLQAVRWPENTVYYAIDPALPATYRVLEAIAHWEATTPITFVKRTTQNNYIYFGEGDGCYSYVGMIGGGQFISVGRGCSTGSTIHEIGHALGLWHEQSRADRDQFVTIHYENIQPQYYHAFMTYTEQGYDGFDHGGFDFNSIMMYHPYSFSINGQPTITRTDGSLYSYQRNRLSAGDLAIINHMYPAPVEEPVEEPPVEEPVMTIAALLQHFQAFVAEGSLQGSGPGKSAGNRLNAFTNKLKGVEEQLKAGNTTTAIARLSDAQKHIHSSGRLKPSHFITGPKASAFNAMIDALKESLRAE
ncbi:Flavastacin precursor [Cesiribacter andamanensis AMV16]|uniref:Flavastacin n=2 Tax=Cesiribacter TaxID=1133570 RepID=M7N3W7_9BACT|nr:Flavastacin precursor [Cesiribacter andamanensis AMV16]